jgi:hypothetical protein
VLGDSDSVALASVRSTMLASARDDDAVIESNSVGAGAAHG